MPKYKLTYLTITTPSYFSGNHRQVLQVIVWVGMTKQELTDAILLEYNLSEYNETYEHLRYGDGWPDLSSEELRDMCDNFIITDDPFSNSDIPTIEEMREFEDNTESTYLYMICEDNDE